jgi:hypothetical protein
MVTTFIMSYSVIFGSISNYILINFCFVDYSKPVECRFRNDAIKLEDGRRDKKACILKSIMQEREVI